MPCSRRSIPTSAARRSTWRRPTATHLWRRRRPNRDGGAPHSKLRSIQAASPLIPAPAFAGVNSSGNPEPKAGSPLSRGRTQTAPQKITKHSERLSHLQIYLALHRILVYLTIYRNQQGGRYVRHETLWWEVGRRPRLARAFRPRPWLGRTSRRRQYDARRAHAGAGRPAPDRARTDRRAAPPRLRDHQGAGRQDRRLVLAEPRHRLSDADLSRGGGLRHRRGRVRQEALRHHRRRPRPSRGG